jgi:hypothetical protein
MKIPPIVPSALCVIAGLLLIGKTVFVEFDMFFFGVGLYFVGKGLFIQNVLTFLSEVKTNR